MPLCAATASDDSDHCDYLSTEGGGSTDPNINSRLARAIEDGKAKDVPNTTMFEALRKLVIIKPWLCTTRELIMIKTINAIDIDTTTKHYYAAACFALL